MKTKGKIVAGALLFLASAANAQFTLDGEIRPRFEYRHGYSTVADSSQDAAAFVNQRTRLNFGYKTEGYNFRVSVQDIRTWGSQPQVIGAASFQNNDGAYIAVHEAWAEAILSPKWSVRFGRQEITYDDHRIFGDLGWQPQSRAHDAALLKFKTDKTLVDVGFAYNQDKPANFGRDAQFGSYKAFQYLWLNRKFGENFTASLLFLNLGKEQLNYDSTITTPAPYYTDNYTQTTGTRLAYKKNKLTVAGAFYYQSGTDASRTVIYKDKDGEYNKKVEAMNYRFEVNYDITTKLSANAGYEHLSGQSQTDTAFSYRTVNHSFNPHFGTNHKFNGYMDLFYVGNHINNVGLNDIFFGLKYKVEKFWISADAHLFSSPVDVFDGYKFNKELADANKALLAATTQAQIDAANASIKSINDNKYSKYKMDKNFGTELDFTCGFNLAKGVAVLAGYSIFVDTETLAYLKGVTYKNNNINAGQGRIDQLNSWGFIMLTFKPTFIKGN
ncbi:MAG: alginate export family protein [Flavobacteriales bacterium]|nr:alginate export family protein [Flavobacteriales bacterium]